MADLMRLLVRIGGDASGAVGAINQAQGATSKAGAAIVGVGKVAGAAMVGLGAAAAAGVLTAGMAYEDSLNTFKAVSGATADEMSKVSARAKELGNDVSIPGASAADAATAMTELAKAGLSVNAAMDASKGVLQTAAAAQTDVGTAANLVGAGLNAFKLKGEDAVRVADLLAGASNASAAEITDVGYALQSSSAVFASSGQSIETLTTMIAQMSNAGINGSDAGTSLKTMMLALQNPSEKAAGIISDLGVKVYDAQGRMNSFRTIIGQLEDGTKNLTQAEKDKALATIFGSDAVRAANVLVGQGVEGFDKMSKAVTKSGAAATVAAAKNAGLRGAIEGVKNQLETAAIETYEQIKGPLTSAVKAFGQLLGHLPNIIGPAFNAIAAVVGPVVEVVGTVIDSIKDKLGGDGGGMFTDFAGKVVGTVRTVVDTIRDWVDENGPLIDRIKTAWAGFGAAVGGYLKAVAGLIGSVFGTIRDWVNDNRSTIQSWATQLGETAATVGDIMAGLYEALAVVIGWIKAIWESGFGKHLINVIATTFGTILKVIGGVLKAIKGVIDIVLGLVKGDWSRVWKGVKELFGGIWDAIVALLKGALKILWEALQGLTKGIMRIIAGLGEWIVTQIVKALAKFVTAVGTWLGNAAYKFVTWVSDLWDIFVALPGKFFGWGKDMIQGLIDGLKSMGSAVVDTVMDLIPGPVKYVVEKALDIHSPSRVFYGYGINTGQGYINGLASMKSAVLGAAGALATDITAGFGAPQLAMPGVAVGSAGRAGTVASAGVGRTVGGVSVSVTNHFDAATAAADKAAVEEMVRQGNAELISQLEQLLG